MARIDELKAQEAAALDEAFSLGVASVSQDKIYTQADLDAAVSKAKSDLKAAVISTVAAEDTDLQNKISAL